MINTFLLRCTLLFVRAAYYLLPVISFLMKCILVILIAFVALLLLVVII